MQEQPKQTDLVSSSMKKIGDDDINHKLFYKPIEVKLNSIPNQLPQGIRIAVKKNIDDNKYNAMPIEEIQMNTTYEKLKNRNQDNILAVLKKKEGIELAICVCMYSEDKKMLKSTLDGIKMNINNLVRSGVNTDKIGVFVIMDGIEKVDSSVVDYFEQLQKRSGIFLNNNSYTAEDIKKLDKAKKEDVQEQVKKNVNKFLFSESELQDRMQRRFSSVKNQYQSIRKLQAMTKQYLKKPPQFNILDGRLRKAFLEQAREQRMKEYGEDQTQVKSIPEDRLINEYAYTHANKNKMMIEALKETDLFCEEYFSTRADLAYLGAYSPRVYQTNYEEKGKLLDGTRQALYLVEERSQEERYTYMNLFMCAKYKNGGKLTSHNWFFNGFCRQLKPKYAVLLDVGLRPEDDALFKMYKYMVANQRVGGVCGYMSLKIEKIEENQQLKDEEIDILTSFCNKFVDIQRTQQMEYHFAHLIDKPFEAIFDFIHVLPGAFSAYNLKALGLNGDQSQPEGDQSKMKGDQRNIKGDSSLMKEYFKSIDDKLMNNRINPSNFSTSDVILRVLLPESIYKCWWSINPDSEQQMLYDQNIYLAEDRILCMGIHKNGFKMAYLPDAYAEVDPIKTVHGLLGQRKRWINGSFFAFEKVKKEMQKSNEFQCLLQFQILYLTLMNSLGYLAPAIFLFTVHIAMQAFRADILPLVLNGIISDPNTSQFYNAFVYTTDFFYILLMSSILFFSLHLTNSNTNFKPYIYIVSTLFGLFNIIVFLVFLINIITGFANGSAFLQNNLQLITNLPGGQLIINVLRFLIIASILLYVLAVLVYVCLFPRLRLIFQLVMGMFSFLFYGPTYMNILNIYALCRMDDISWGTKGLDASSSGKNAHLKESWRIIKFIHVSKYVFWNIVCGVLLLSFGASYLPRFFITLAIVIIIGVTMLIKVLLGAIYMVKYRCSSNVTPSTNGTVSEKSAVDVLREQVKQEMMKEIEEHLKEITKKQGCGNKQFLSSIIIPNQRPNEVRKRDFQKHKQEVESRSKIHGKPQIRPTFPKMLPTIPEQGRGMNPNPSRDLSSNASDLPLLGKPNPLPTVRTFQKQF